MSDEEAQANRRLLGLSVGGCLLLLFVFGCLPAVSAALWYSGLLG